MKIVTAEVTGVPHEHLLNEFEALFGDQQSMIARDLKINFKRVIEDSSLSKEEAVMTVLAVARSLQLTHLATAARTSLKLDGIDPAHVQEAEETAAIMGMLNTYYRFRHFVDSDGDAGYGAAKLRMQSLGNPQLGKQRFEMLAFAVSIINGCEKCVTSHEKALRGLEVENEKLHDLARLAATLKGLQSLVI